MKNYEEMCKNLARALRGFLLAFAVLFALIVLTPKAVAIIDRFEIEPSKPIDHEGLLKLGEVLVIPLVQGTVAFFANFFVHLEVHTTLDKIFGMRRRTSRALIGKMTEKCKQFDCQYLPVLLKNQTPAMSKFYLLEDSMKYDRSLLYDRWLRYYLDLYIIAFSVLTVAVSFILRFTYFTGFNVLFVAAFAFVLIATVALLDATLRLPSRLLNLAEASPLRLLDKDELSVQRGMLSVCGAPALMCPWKQSLDAISRTEPGRSSGRVGDHPADRIVP